MLGAATMSVTHVIDGRTHDLGGFHVKRLLPTAAVRLVGPFIFFDHMGPAVFTPGAGIDVRPHPHIGLSTVTYLFEGEMVHRDSLGTEMTIRPGAINWMTAGRGIVHSERSGSEARARGGPMHGLQLWVALPREHEESEPAFDHYPAEALPSLSIGGADVRVLAGSAYGARSPVRTHAPTLYVDARLHAGSHLAVPVDTEERAVYVVEGRVECAGTIAEAGRMLVLSRGADVSVRSEGEAHVALVGGAPMDGPRHIFWNFVSSSRERIEQAKRDWAEGRFPRVPGDDVEFIPLPT